MTDPTTKKTKLIVKSHGNTFSASLPWDCNIADIFEVFNGLLVSAGFNPVAIENHVSEWAEDINSGGK